jgi:hypothetical protein
MLPTTETQINALLDRLGKIEKLQRGLGSSIHNQGKLLFEFVKAYHNHVLKQQVLLDQLLTDVRTEQQHLMEGFEDPIYINDSDFAELHNKVLNDQQPHQGHQQQYNPEFGFYF